MTEQNSARTGVSEQLQTLLLSTTDVSDFLHQLAVLSTQVLDKPLSCAITMRYDANAVTVAASDQWAERLDETQYRNRVGPCLEARDTGQVVSSPDSRTEQRWPAYNTSALREGLRCSASFPLAAGGETFGALNVYGFDAPNMFGETEQRQLRLFAAQASGALRLATRLHKDAVLLAQLEEALNSRTVIDQALGILIARHEVSAVEAFNLLRRLSQSRKAKLRDLAAGLVADASGAPPVPGRPFDCS